MNQHLTVYPIEKVREQFPALQRKHAGKGVTYFDGPGGSQVVKSSIDAIASYMENGGANLHGTFPSSIETENIIEEAKQAIADMLGVKSSEVAFGANMTTLTFSIARSLGKHWDADDEIVVTELDHRANVDPWLTVAADNGVTVRWIKVNPETLTLDLEEINNTITQRTKLVAVGLASNAVGTINEKDIQTISKRAAEVDALVAVDAVHAAPHIPIDRDQLGADILMCSAYKFFGPHIGIATIREHVFNDLSAYKLVPAPEYIPDKLETGTQNHEGIAGIKPAIEFIASFGEGENRRERILSGIRVIESYENKLASKVREAFSRMEKVTLFQGGQHISKTPTIAFRVKGYTPREVCERLAAAYGIFVADGDFYASTLANKLGINETGGWIRAGLAPYNTEAEVDQFIEVIQGL